MEQKQESCPCCGGTQLVKGKQIGQGGIYPCNGLPAVWKQHKLVHIVCKSCGSIVRSYIEDPQDFN